MSIVLNVLRGFTTFILGLGALETTKGAILEKGNDTAMKIFVSLVLILSIVLIWWR